MHSVCAVRMLLYIRQNPRSHRDSSLAITQSTTDPSTTGDASVILDTVDRPVEVATFSSTRSDTLNRRAWFGEVDWGLIEEVIEMVPVGPDTLES